MTYHLFLEGNDRSERARKGPVGPTRHKGFALVELMVVLAVMAVLAVMGYFGAQSLLPSYRLKGAASMVRGDLNQARALAARKQREYRVTFGANKKSPGNDYELHEGNQRAGSSVWTLTLARSFSDYRGVSVKNVTDDPVFYPRGTGSLETITLQNNRGDEKKITVFLSGKIRVK